MSKSNHAGTGDAPQNQNNAMSDDPRDGQRGPRSASVEGSGAPGEQPDGQGPDMLAEFGQRGSKHA